MKPNLFFLHSDASILDLMKKGDEEAIVVLYRANKKMITSFVLRNSGTQDDADDMLQEAVIILWERVHAGRFEYSAQLSTFIFATVKNIWLRRLARHKREIPTELHEFSTVSDELSPLDIMIETDKTKTVAAALIKLGDPCKTLLILFYWEECSMETIAERMEFANADTVKSKKYQCKKALEKILSATI